MLIQPKENEMVLAVSWADNFDMIVESATGRGSVHTTHLVAFQEQTENTSLEYIHVSRIYLRFSTNTFSCILRAN